MSRLGVAVSLNSQDNPLFHPGRAAGISIAGDVSIGVIGELHPDIAAAFDLDAEPVIYFELRLDDLLARQRDDELTASRFQSLSRFPAANRDLALVVPAEVPASRVQQLIERVRLVERAELFDVYAGENVLEGTRSLAFRIRFRAADRTLTAEEVNRAINGLTRALEREVGAAVRG